MGFRWKDLIKRIRNVPPSEDQSEENGQDEIIQEEERERFEHDMSILGEEDVDRGEKLQEEAEKEVVSAAEDSFKKLHVIRRGRCPACGEHLHKHLFASVCDGCGWHTFDTPNSGPVKVHLRGSDGIISGERCYEVKSGAVLIMKQDVVTARIPARSVSWVEYMWDDEEISRRHKQLVERMDIRCGWCHSESDPDKDGFHLVHIALGATQERYCFCSDVCYEAFRKIYPSRVHRDCYERNCSACELCIKRYGDEADGLQMLAKDYLSISGQRSKSRGGKTKQ